MDHPLVAPPAGSGLGSEHYVSNAVNQAEQATAPVRMTGMQPGLKPRQAPPQAPARVAPAPPQQPLVAQPAPGLQPPEQVAPVAPIGPTVDSIEELLHHLHAIVVAARTVPLGTSVMIHQGEVLEVIERALAAVPTEMKEARWVLKERDEVLAKAQSDANVLLDEARNRVAQMVQRSEVARAAERRARQVTDDAEAHARKRRHLVDDYCEERLEQFDEALSQIHSQVQSVRNALAPEPLTDEEVARRTAAEQPTEAMPAAGVNTIEPPKIGPGTVFDQDKF